MNIPFLDLKAQYHALKPALDAALVRVAESQVCILGSEVDALEKTLAEYCGSRFALGVSSGTDALQMALMALGIGAGDEVIVPTFSFFATAGVVARLGATPVFVDSEAEGLTIDPDCIEERITPRTKAIVPVHLFGQCAEMQEIMRIADKHGLPVVEDAAQAIGAEYRSSGKENPQRAGAMGIMGCFSFYPTKNLGAFGDAGLITTNDEELYTKLKQMRNHGMEPRYYHKFVGGNFRMDALQAAVLNVKFPHLEAWHEARRRNADLYSRLFAEVMPHFSDVVERDSEESRFALPVELHKASGARNHHIYHQYTIRASHRDRLRSFLAERGIGTEIYYPLPLHRQECFAYLVSNDADFAVANCAAAEVLALPVYPELSREQIHYVVESVAAFYKAHKIRRP
jgi:dTDP-4-amino-4,6-dideoxygalactose transaminase